MDRAAFDHAAKLLALSLTDEMIDSLRADYGHTNAAVLLHWRGAVLSLLTAEPERPQAIERALRDLLAVIAADDLIPESVSYMRQAREALSAEPSDERTCPCGFDNEPWHYPRGGVCSVGAAMPVRKKP